MKKLLTIPGGPDPFVVETNLDPVFRDSLIDRAIIWIGSDPPFMVPVLWLSDTPKRMVQRFKSAGYMIDDAIRRGWASRTTPMIQTPTVTLSLTWFVEYSGKDVDNNFISKYSIPDDWTEEVEVDE